MTTGYINGIGSATGEVYQRLMEFILGYLEDPNAFVAYVIIAVYIIILLAVITDKFLLPAVLAIAHRYSLSRDTTGLLIGVANLVPETTTIFLSFSRPGIAMTEFAFVTNIGIAVTTLTAVPALAFLIAGTS